MRLTPWEYIISYMTLLVIPVLSVGIGIYLGSVVGLIVWFITLTLYSATLISSALKETR